MKFREKSWAIFCEYFISRVLIFSEFLDFVSIKFHDFSQIAKFTKFNTHEKLSENKVHLTR